jgi:hypothetical protein
MLLIAGRHRCRAVRARRDVLGARGRCVRRTPGPAAGAAIQRAAARSSIGTRGTGPGPPRRVSHRSGSASRVRLASALISRWQGAAGAASRCTRREAPLAAQSRTRAAGRGGREADGESAESERSRFDASHAARCPASPLLSTHGRGLCSFRRRLWHGGIRSALPSEAESVSRGSKCGKHESAEKIYSHERYPDESTLKVRPGPGDLADSRCDGRRGSGTRPSPGRAVRAVQP